MSDIKKLPLPKECTYVHFSRGDIPSAHFCHVQWFEPGDDVPWNVTSEWYGALADLSIVGLENQGFLKLVEFVMLERANDSQS